MKRYPVRLFFRRTFRRARILLPVLLLFVVTLVVYLPISAPWLARRAEAQLESLLGVPVQIGHLEVRIASAQVIARDLLLGGVDGVSPILVSSLQIDGELYGLLAGGDRWPSVVRAEGMSPLLFERSAEDGYQVAGAWRQLESLFNRERMEETPRGVDDSSTGSSARFRRLPRIIVSDLTAFVDAPDDQLPPMTIIVDTLDIPQRAAADSPWRVLLEGSATAISTERFSLNGLYFPTQERFVAEGRLGSISLPFFIPSFGNFRGTARQIELDFEARRVSAQGVEGSLTLQTGRFEIAQDRIGGTRWQDDDLVIRLRGGYDAMTQEIALREASFLGNEIDVTAQAFLQHGGTLPGEARLSINRLPAAAFVLARGEITERFGIVVDPIGETPTLRLDAFAAGEFANPLTLDSEVSLTVQNWSVAQPMLADPIRIRNLTATVTPDALQLAALDLGYRELSLLARGRLPVLGEEDLNGTEGRLFLDLEGNASDAVDLLDQLGMLPPEVSFLNLPIRLRSSFDAAVIRTNEGLLRLEERRGTADVALTWRTGELGLRRLDQPLRLETGSLRFSNKRLSLERFRVGLGGLSLTADGSLTGGMISSDEQPLRFLGSLNLAGRIEELLPIVGREVDLPVLPPDLRGGFSLDLRLSSGAGPLAEPDYTARVILNGVEATVATFYRQVRFEDIGADIRLDRERLSLRNGQLRLIDENHGNSTVDFNVVIDDEKARVTGRAGSHLEILPTLLPRELNDVFMEGAVQAAGFAELIPRLGLPEGPDLARRWLALLQQPGVRPSIFPKTPLLARYELAYQPGPPISIAPRDFPVMISNIRPSSLVLRDGGLHVGDSLVDLDQDRDVRLSGSITFGAPTVIRFDAIADHLNINQWMENWGRKPWAQAPFNLIPRWQSIEESYQFVDVQGAIRTDSARFLQFNLGRTSSELFFESWSRQSPRLALRNLETLSYQGFAISPGVFMTFPANEFPHLRVQASIFDIELQEFMDDLLEREQNLNGLLTASLNFRGQLLNYPSYTGWGRYQVTESAVVGRVFFQFWRDIINIVSASPVREATMDGTVFMRNQRVYFPDFSLLHPAVTLTADGYVDFARRLNFEVQASVISNRLRRIPILGIVGVVVDRIGRTIVTYRLEGRLESPRYFPIPTVVDRLVRLRELVDDSEEFPP